MGSSFGYEPGTFDFDPQTFARSLYDTVEASQGTIGRRNNKLLDSPANETDGDLGENAINAFLRILGMPAIRNKEDLTLNGEQLANVEITENFRTSIFSQGGTVNYFSELLGGDLQKALDGLAQRDSLLSAKLDPEEFNSLVTEPLPIRASIDGPATRKAPILPLVVDSSIPIYPQSKRVAPLFNIDDYIISGGKKRLSRPFLEHIIYMRAKVYSGASNVKLQAELIGNIAAQTPKERGGGVMPEETLTEALKEFTVLELKVQEKFLQTLKAMAIDYEHTRRRAIELRGEVIYAPKPSRRARDKSGSTIKPKDKDFVSQLDNKIAVFETELNLVDNFLLTLPSETIEESDNIRRIGQQVKTGNISADLLVSDFNNVLASDRISLERLIRSEKERRSRKIREFEILRERLMFYTGEGVGLSIFDVLCVLYALFTVSLEDVFGLVNPDALERIKTSDVFYSIPTAAGPPNPSTLFDTDKIDKLDAPSSVGAALTAVEAKVKDTFDLIDQFVIEAIASGEATTNSNGSGN